MAGWKFQSSQHTLLGQVTHQFFVHRCSDLMEEDLVPW